jgi:hypothetical protein
MSEQLFEPSDCNACIFNNSAHQYRVHPILSRNSDEIGCDTLTNGTVSFTNSPARIYVGHAFTNT